MSDDLVKRLRVMADRMPVANSQMRSDAADRIEELETKLEALDHAYDSIVQALRFEALRTDDAEAKLAKALEALTKISLAERHSGTKSVDLGREARAALSALEENK